MKQKIDLRKMTVSDIALGAIKKSLLKTLAMYRYNEFISNASLPTAGQQSWK